MTVLMFTVGATAALLLGVYLTQTAWVLPVGLAGLVVFVGLSFVRRGRWLWLLRRVRVTALGVSLALLWLTLYGVVVMAPAQALEHQTVRLEAVVTDWPQAVDHGCADHSPGRGGGSAQEQGHLLRRYRPERAAPRRPLFLRGPLYPRQPDARGGEPVL